MKAIYESRNEAFNAASHMGGDWDVCKLAAYEYVIRPMASSHELRVVDEVYDKG